MCVFINIDGIPPYTKSKLNVKAFNVYILYCTPQIIRKLEESKIQSYELSHFVKNNKNNLSLIFQEYSDVVKH